MARRGVSEAVKQAAAIQAGRRMVARGDRPTYRIKTARDGQWTVDTLPWLPLNASSHREALDDARTAIAEWLDVPPDAFDVEA